MNIRKAIWFFPVIFALSLYWINPVYPADDADFQKGNIELGGCIGTPSGIGSRFWFTDKFGIDASLGLSFYKYPAFALDLIYEEFTLKKTGLWDARLFFGLGSLTEKEEKSFKSNVRIPVGISVPFYRYALNLSVFVAPALEVKPDRELEFNWGIGVRYNFGTGGKLDRRQRTLERKVGELTGDVGSLKDGLSTTKDRLAETEDKLSAAKGRLATIEEKLSDMSLKLDRTEGELSLTKDRLTNATMELDGTKNRLDVVKNELAGAKKSLDDKQTEIQKKQAELDKAKDIINNAFTGKEKEEEEKKLVSRQDELNRQNTELEKEKKTWEQIRKREASKRDDLKKKCEEKGGIINDEGYCVCHDNEDWDPRTNKCDCAKGFTRNAKTGKCDACEVIKYGTGECAPGGCDENENMIPMKKGPNKYACIQRCRKKNEVWSKRKETCVCKDGFTRDPGGECVPRQ